MEVDEDETSEPEASAPEEGREMATASAHAHAQPSEGTRQSFSPSAAAATPSDVRAQLRPGASETQEEGSDHASHPPDLPPPAAAPQTRAAGSAETPTPPVTHAEAAEPASDFDQIDKAVTSLVGDLHTTLANAFSTAPQSAGSVAAGGFANLTSSLGAWFGASAAPNHGASTSSARQVCQLRSTIHYTFSTRALLWQDCLRSAAQQ